MLFLQKPWGAFLVRAGPFLASEGLLLPQLVVLAKGLSAGLLKSAALLVHRSLLPALSSTCAPAGRAQGACRPVEPCVLACAVSDAALGSVLPSRVASRAEELDLLIRCAARPQSARCASISSKAGPK